MTPHFRVVRFAPTPEVNEPVNVALLFVDQRARLVTDSEFQKLECVAPRFNQRLLRFLLDGLSSDLISVSPNEAHVFLSSRTAQIQVGEPHALTRQISADFERQLIDTYLRRQFKAPKTSERQRQLIDTLVDQQLGKIGINPASLLHRAKPEDFLSAEGVGLLQSKAFKFSRVFTNSVKIVLMDGLNLAVSDRSYLRRRAMEIGFGFFNIGNVREQLQEKEGRRITRVSFVFNRPQSVDADLKYAIDLAERDTDLHVTADSSGLHELKAELES